MEIKQSTTPTIPFEMVDTDGAAVTGLTPSVQLRKPGGSFVATVNSATEIGLGCYEVVLTAAETNTLGDIIFSVSATGAETSRFALPVVAKIESDTIAAIAALNDLSAAGVRAELATELARLDVAVSTRNATVPPTSEAIADAVWDELLSGHATAGTTGAGMSAASASGDPWSTVVPASYDDGTAGAALGRLNNTPAANPVAVTPAPAEDPDLCVVYIDTEDIIGETLTDLEIKIAPTGARPFVSAAGRLVATDARTMAHTTGGRYTINLETGLSYRVSCRRLWKDLIIVAIAPGTETLNLKDV